jgi:hypothetical protein
MECLVLALKSGIRFQWAYTEEQVAEGSYWDCTDVWLHYRSTNTETLIEDLDAAVYQLARRKSEDHVWYSLLVNPRGMF